MAWSCICLTLASQAGASDFTADFWKAEAANPVCPVTFTTEKAPNQNNTDESKLVIKSDQFREKKVKSRVFTGNVQIERGDLQLKTESMQWELDRSMSFSEGLQLFHPEGAAEIGHAKLDLEELVDVTPLTDVSFVLYELPLHGALDSLQVNDKKVTANKLALSGCPPSSRFWSIGANKTTINRDSHRVTMRGVWFKAGKVPLLYIPYFTFKPRDRTSGFSTTQFDYRNDNGLILKQPIRFFTESGEFSLEPRYLAKNGFQLGVEARVSPFDLTLDWVPEDQNVSHGLAREKNRWRVKTTFETEREAWSTHFNYVNTSDFRYRHDFEFDAFNKAGFANVNSAGIQYRTRDLRVNLLAEQYESTSRDQVLAERLPSLDLSWQPVWRRLTLRSSVQHADLVSMEHEGRRTHLEQHANLNISPSWFDWHIEASTGRTSYDLDNYPTELSTRQESSYATRGAIHFDKTTERFDLTLSPMFYYFNRDVSDIEFQPVFDRPRPLFRFYRLFDQQERLSIDAIENEKRLTTGIRFSSRSNDVPIRKFNLDLAYVQERETPEDRSYWAGALVYRYSNKVSVEHSQTFNSTTHYPSAQRQTLLLYSPSPSKSLYLAGHERDDTLSNQMELGLRWPLQPKVELLAGVHYDLDREETVEARFGLTLKGCCVRTVIYVQRGFDWEFENNEYSAEPANRVAIEFTLTGLGSFGGKRIESLLAQKRFYSH